MTPVEAELLKFLVIGIGVFGSMIYTLAFAGPQWATKKLLQKAPDADRKWFKEIGEDWITYRVLPEKGFRTRWRLQTSAGDVLGQIDVLTLPKNGNPVTIDGMEYRFFKFMKGLVQDGFIVRSSEGEIYLESDRSSGRFEKLKTNFRPMRSGEISVKGIGGRKIEISRNGRPLGQIMILKGLYPRLAAISPEATKLEKALLFYCGLSS